MENKYMKLFLSPHIWEIKSKFYSIMVFFSIIDSSFLLFVYGDGHQTLSLKDAQ